jgi:hypothetical protein
VRKRQYPDDRENKQPVIILYTSHKKNPFSEAFRNQRSKKGARRGAFEVQAP